MTINEILNSGLLELYILDQLSDKDKAIVEEALKQSSELKAETSAIQESLLRYAQLYAINPNPSLKTKILSKLENKADHNTSSLNIEEDQTKTSIFSWILLLSCLGLIGAYYISQKNLANLKSEYDKKIIICDSITNVQASKISILSNIQDTNNRIIELKATPKYPSTQIYFHNNPELKKNYIQIKNLPPLANNESFQLWALKGTDAPTPLDVFETDKENIFEVKYVDSPDAYAITIEPRGGGLSPTLENLIGVIGIEG